MTILPIRSWRKPRIARTLFTSRELTLEIRRIKYYHGVLFYKFIDPGRIRHHFPVIDQIVEDTDDD